MPDLPNCHDARSASSATDAFKIALIEATPKLKRYALHLYRRCPEAAEDAVQETLCRALENRHSFSVGSNMAAWLRTILHHAFCAERKSSTAKYLEFTADANYAKRLIAADNPERSLIVQETLEATSTLKPLVREILFASGIGRSLDEMAEEFGVPQNTLKSHISRGRAQLAELTGGL
jgi:RNA polymerase sigma-70 factor (ECF subfamily)